MVLDLTERGAAARDGEQFGIQYEDLRRWVVRPTPTGPFGPAAPPTSSPGP
jgi:hypothetical protein